MKKLALILLTICLMSMVSCSMKGSGCPYKKAQAKCEAGCSASCEQAKKMKEEGCGKCGSGSCSTAAKCGADKGAAKCGADKGAAKCGADKAEAKSCH